MLQIKNLHSGYGELEVLKGIDMHIGDKEIVALIGPNGAGKSTVIKSVFNIAHVSSGKINFKGKNIRGLKTHELIREGICYVCQGRIIFGNLSVRENLEIGVELIKDNKNSRNSRTLAQRTLFSDTFNSHELKSLRGKASSKKEIERRINEVYKKFPILREREKKFAFSLSGGERQMLALGRALMLKPDLLMLDEPSLGLSPKLQKEIFSTIKKLRDDFNISILIVEQNAKKAIEIADRTYLLEDGKIALEGGREILRNKKIQQVYLGGRY